MPSATRFPSADSIAFPKKMESAGVPQALCAVCKPPNASGAALPRDCHCPRNRWGSGGAVPQMRSTLSQPRACFARTGASERAIDQDPSRTAWQIRPRANPAMPPRVPRYPSGYAWLLGELATRRSDVFTAHGVVSVPAIACDLRISETLDTSKGSTNSPSQPTVFRGMHGCLLALRQAFITKPKLYYIKGRK